MNSKKIFVFSMGAILAGSLASCSFEKKEPASATPPATSVQPVPPTPPPTPPSPMSPPAVPVPPEVPPPAVAPAPETQGTPAPTPAPETSPQPGPGAGETRPGGSGATTEQQSGY